MRSPGGPRFASFLDYMVQHRTAANLLLLLMLLFGIAAGTQIRTQFFPDFVREDVDIDISWSGAGPEDMDRTVVEILGPQLLSINGVDEATSVAREGRASIELKFEDGWDMGQATDEVKAAVDQARSSLPDGIDEPVITRGVYRDRVTDVVIYGPVDIDQLARFAEDLQTQLFREGVTRVSLRGLENPIIRVNVGEAMLIQHNLTIDGIADVVAAEMETTPAGDVSGGSARLRTGQNRRSEQELGEIVLKAPAQGEKLHLRNVAEIKTEGVESGRAYFHTGMPAVVLQVYRSAQGDTISIQRDVERVTAAYQESLPEGVLVQLTRTRSQNIIDRLSILIENGLFGLGLVLAFLFLFLSSRTAFWVAAGIPVAMTATIGLMYFFGLTLNMVSVFALIICLGIVVDDAIVVGEHADFLHRRGYSPAEAASLAARRMTAPVFSASITTLIAFAGLVAIGGRFGTLIADIPFTVSVVLIASLVESFLILPAHMRHSLAASKKQHWYDWPNRMFNRAFVWYREHIFRRVMSWVITARYPTLGFAVMILALSLSLFFDGSVRWRFFNAPERTVISASFAMVPGADRTNTKDMVKELERALYTAGQRYEEEYGSNPLKFALTVVGGNMGRGLAGADTKDADLLGGITIELIDPDLRPYSAYGFIRDWRKEINRPPLLETLSVRGDHSGPGGDAIDIRLYGASTETLKAAAESLKLALSSLDGVSGLEDTLAYDKPELNLTLTPRGEALGFNTDDVARILRNRLEGVEVAEFPVGRRTATVKVLMPDDEVDSAFLYTTRIRTNAGAYVPLNEIVEVSSSYGFASVRRTDGLKTLQVTGDISEDDPEAASLVMKRLTEEFLPQLAAEFDVESEVRGLAEQESSFLTDAMFGFALCLAGIYLTLAWIFESWTRPLTIMLIIPFGAIGMLWGHYLHGIPLSMFSVVGFIGMSGIIINDSIVLVTTIDDYAKSQPFKKALINGVSDRLRPVILTSATTVFGLAPLLFETSRQAQFLLPTVITLSYGLAVGLFLVISITPALLAIQHDAGMAISSGRRLAKIRGRKPLTSNRT
ncbi:efflux RND transporter permease subunit [Roseibium sp.]|uniref:efflux RND transporter permease subunit n=1 Tax=Roseibium sp. TaxID=1936156 RepID=UPI003B51552C